MSPKTLVSVGGAMILVAVLVFWMTLQWLEAPSFEFIVIPTLLACMVVVVAGAGAILRTLVIWLSGILRWKDSLRIFPEMVLRNVIPARPRLPTPLINDLGNFVLVYVWILWILWMIFMILPPRIPIGLFADFNGERTVGVEKSPWTETMAVYVDAKRGFFVNGKAVAREELRSKLQEELLRRGIWVVYFEADGDCLYMDAVYAIDTIQGLGAKLIWITPKTREEWKKRGVS
jgi:biopolymer transport protein ExbD